MELIRKIKLAVFPEFKVTLPQFTGELSPHPVIMPYIYNLIVTQMVDMKTNKLPLDHGILPSNVVDECIRAGHIKMYSTAVFRHYYISPDLVKTLNEYRLTKIKG